MVPLGPLAEFQGDGIDASIMASRLSRAGVEPRFRGTCSNDVSEAEVKSGIQKSVQRGDPILFEIYFRLAMSCMVPRVLLAEWPTAINVKSAVTSSRRWFTNLLNRVIVILATEDVADLKSISAAASLCRAMCDADRKCKSLSRKQGQSFEKENVDPLSRPSEEAVDSYVSYQLLGAALRLGKKAASPKVPKLRLASWLHKLVLGNRSAVSVSWSARVSIR